MNNALVEAVNRGDPNEFMQIGREQMAGNTLRRVGNAHRHQHTRQHQASQHVVVQPAPFVVLQALQAGQASQPAWGRIHRDRS